MLLMDALVDELKRINDPNYLGDFQVVNGLLRTLVGNLLIHSGDFADAAEFEKAAEKAAKSLARIFLGQDKNWQAPAWFSPGQIDVYLGEQEGIASEDPEERVAGAIINMVTDILEVAYSDAKAPEQWRPVVDQIYREYTFKVMGLPQAGYKQHAAPTQPRSSQSAGRPRP